MEKPTIIQTERAISVYQNGRTHSIRSDHPAYHEAVEAIRNEEWEKLMNVLDVRQAVQNYSYGNVKIDGDNVYYKDKELHGALVDKILSFMRSGYDFKPLGKFLNKLMQNPSMRSREQAYEYIQRYQLPICDDGDFLAYKAVNSNMRDKFSNTISYLPGEVVGMDRSECDDDHNRACAPSLHAGNIDYVRGYGNGPDRYVMVKINPRNIVSCPTDCSWQKLRVCRLESVKEIPREEVRPFERDYFGEYGQDEEDWEDECPECEENNPVEEIAVNAIFRT